MANTYTQIYIHFVFAVKGRASIINKETEDKLYAYISGACANRGHRLMAIGGMPDHVHLLVGFAPTDSLSNFVQSIKIGTSKCMHEDWGHPVFAWQSGYGAFSYSKSLVPNVVRYIQSQKAHHAKKSFDEEIREIITLAGLDYDERYVLKGEPIIDGIH